MNSTSKSQAYQPYPQHAPNSAQKAHDRNENQVELTTGFIMVYQTPSPEP